MRAPRIAAVAFVTAGTLSLSACFVLPPSVTTNAPASPSAPAETAPPPETGTPATAAPSATAAPGGTAAPSATSSPPPAAPTSTAPVPDPPSDGAYDFQVDDGSDTWSFTVTGVEEHPPITFGELEPGDRAVAVRIDARHDRGNASFVVCFDVGVFGDDGRRYDFFETAYTFGTEQDLTDVSRIPGGETFTGGRALVMMPEGVQPVAVEVSAVYANAVAIVDLP